LHLGKLLDPRLSQFENEIKRSPLELTFPLVAGDRRADDLALVALGVLHLAGREGLSGGGAGTAGRWLEAGCKGCGMGELSGIGVGGAGEGAGDGTGSGLRVVSGRNEDLWWFLAAAGATDAAAWKRKRDFGWKSGGGGLALRLHSESLYLMLYILEYIGPPMEENSRQYLHFAWNQHMLLVLPVCLFR